MWIVVIMGRWSDDSAYRQYSDDSATQTKKTKKTPLDSSMYQYYTSSASAEFTECIDYIESLFNSMDCNAFICCGDFNTSFERSNGHTKCLNSFITKKNYVFIETIQFPKKIVHTQIYF